MLPVAPCSRELLTVHLLQIRQSPVPVVRRVGRQRPLVVVLAGSGPGHLGEVAVTPGWVAGDVLGSVSRVAQAFPLAQAAGVGDAVRSEAVV